MKHLLKAADLSAPKDLTTLIESRRHYTLVNAELNIFETYQDAYNVPLTFTDFVLTSMMRGKKIMHLPDRDAFDYLPGESVIVAPNQTMVIDFPEATEETPSQCIALAIDQQFIQQTIHYLDQYHNNDPDEQHTWSFNHSRYHFENDHDVSELINKLVTICSSNSRVKNIFADLSLKELLVRLIQSQHLFEVVEDAMSNSNKNREHAILHYIEQHLYKPIHIQELSKMAYMNRTSFFVWFKEQFGQTPLEYINKRRMQQAKVLLSSGKYSVHQVADHCGYDDVNYFVRLFKKTEGFTPGAFLQRLKG